MVGPRAKALCLYSSISIILNSFFLILYILPYLHTLVKHKIRHKNAGLLRDRLLVSNRYLTVNNPSDSAGYRIGAEAPCADVDVARSAIYNSLDALDIGFPCSVSTSVRVGNLDSEGNALSADITFCHQLTPPSTAFFVDQHMISHV